MIEATKQAAWNRSGYRPGGPKRFGTFLKAVAANDCGTLEKKFGSRYVSEATASVQKSAMGSESGSIGGWLIPPDYSAELMETFAEDSFIFPRARVLPMTGVEMTCPVIDVLTAQAAGTSPFFGGIKFNWIAGNNLPLTETEPKFRGVELKAWHLIGYATVSNQWLADLTPEAESYVLQLFAQAAAWQAEYAFLRGAGAGGSMPLGVLNSGALIATARGSSNTIINTDISTMAGSLIPYSWKNAIWVTHPSTLPQITKIAQYYLNDGDAPDGVSGSMVGHLMAKPLFISDKSPVLGTTGDLLLWDPSLYVIGWRNVPNTEGTNPMILIEASDQTAFTTMQTVFRVSLRLDGKPMMSLPITLADGATQASPYVALHS